MTFIMSPWRFGLSSYLINQCIRFNDDDSSYMYRTPSVAGNRKTWTWSGWVKYGNIALANSTFFAAGDGTVNNRMQISMTNGELQIYGAISASMTIHRKSSALLRDPSAWYHIVVAIDVTEATADDRVKAWINGVQVTSWSAVTTPSQNEDQYINSTEKHWLATDSQSAGLHHDGYLADVHFVDGAALTASDFGEFDANGNWVPVEYTGTYGTNGFHIDGADSSALGKNAAVEDATGCSDTALFDGANDYTKLSTSLIGGANTKTMFFSTWVKRETDSTNQYIFIGDGVYGGQCHLNLNPSNQVYFYCHNVASSAARVSIITTQTITVADGWTHILASWDGTNAHLYINGVDAMPGSFTLANVDGRGDFATTSVGATNSGAAKFSGHLADFIYAQEYIDLSDTAERAKFINTDGSPVTWATALAGITTPLIAMHLDADEAVANFADNADGTGQAFTITGTLASGETLARIGAGDYATSGLTPADQMLDSPTDDAANGVGNYCTWSAVDKNATVVIDDGNLEANSGVTASAHRPIRGTIGITSKTYFEITTSGGTTGMINIFGAAQRAMLMTDGNYVGNSPKSLGMGYSTTASNMYYAGVTLANGASTNLVDGTWGVAIDPVNGEAWLRDSTGSWIGGGDPDTGTSPTYTWTADSEPWFPAISFYNSPTSFTATLNTGQSSFSHSQPTTFKTHCTANLPAPAIPDPSGCFQSTLYMGDGTSSHEVNQTGNSTFQPDMVWIKDRDTAYDHFLMDNVRTAPYYINPNLAVAQGSAGTTLQSFDADGFTVGASGGFNANTKNHVAWQWKEGATAGVDIINPTLGAGAGTFAHSLNGAPKFMIAKVPTSADWMYVYHEGLAATHYLRLGDTVASAAASSLWNDTAPTSSVVNYGTYFGGATSIWYLFEEIPGFSAFGPYTGNGSVDGPFAYCGFRPAFVMIKRTDNTSNWAIFDTARNPYNPVDLKLNANGATVESASDPYEFTSTGFKLRGTAFNISGGTYIYAAFAEHPFGGEGISQARAR